MADEDLYTQRLSRPTTSTTFESPEPEFTVGGERDKSRTTHVSIAWRLQHESAVVENESGGWSRCRLEHELEVFGDENGGGGGRRGDAQRGARGEGRFENGRADAKAKEQDLGTGE